MAETPTPVLPLGEYLLKFAKDIAIRAKRGEDSRTQTTIALHRRFRGASLSDRIGVFIPGGTGMWRGDVDDDLQGVDIKSVNVVKPTVKMNMSALSSARVEINNEPAKKIPELRGAANVADGINSFINESKEHWAGGLESRINQMVQTGYGAFIQVRHNPDKQSQYVDTQEWSEHETSMPGEYACSQCGSGGPFEQGEEEESDTTECPNCGKEAEVIKSPEMANIPKPGQSEKFCPGDIETRVSSCLEHRVDERASQGGNLLLANWFEHHYLETPEQMETDFPGFKVGSPGQWCYALRWKWALETGDDVFAPNYQTRDYNQRYERRNIYLCPEAYRNRIEPEDWDMRDGSGKVLTFKRDGQDVELKVKRGDKLINLFPDGFCYSVTGEKLLPYARVVNFRQEWSYYSFMPDAHSFWGQPIVELLQIQDDWNTLYTIDIQHRERNSINQIIYNSLALDADAFEHDLVSTQEGWSQPDGVPIGHYVQQLNAAPMTEAVSGLKFLYEILPYIGGAPPESLGVDPPGDDNYHAQLLRKQSSLGQLQPAGESKANCKVHYERNFYRLAQQYWPEERFEWIRTRFGEEWKEDDIEAFLNCDIDLDLITNYAEGTETPTSYIERRIDLEQAIQQFIALKQVPPMELIRQWFELTGIDFDIDGGEADERLADARYETIKQGLSQLAGKVPNSPSVDPQTGAVGPSMLVQRVMAHPQLKVLPREGHQVAIDFYVAREKATMAQDMPDVNLIDCLEEMIKRHEQATVEQGRTKTMQDIAIQEPIAEAQGAMGGGGQEKESVSIAYKDMPEDIKRQAEEKAGFQPSQDPPKPPDGAQDAAANLQAKQAEVALNDHQKQQDRAAQVMNSDADREHDLRKLQMTQAHELQKHQMEITSRERIAEKSAKAAAKRPTAKATK